MGTSLKLQVEDKLKRCLPYNSYKDADPPVDVITDELIEEGYLDNSGRSRCRLRNQIASVVSSLFKESLGTGKPTIYHELFNGRYYRISYSKIILHMDYLAVYKRMKHNMQMLHDLAAIGGIDQEPFVIKANQLLQESRIIKERINIRFRKTG